MYNIDWFVVLVLLLTLSTMFVVTFYTLLAPRRQAGTALVDKETP